MTSLALLAHHGLGLHHSKNDDTLLGLLLVFVVAWFFVRKK